VNDITKKLIFLYCHTIGCCSLQQLFFSIKGTGSAQKEFQAVERW